MKKGAQKKKGNSYEIKIARKFSRWWSGNTKEDIFWRTAGSGAKATKSRKKDTSFYGDITFLPSPDDLLVWIDCKDRRTATLNNLIVGNCPLKRWHREEAEKQKNLSIKKPILIIFKLYRKKDDFIYFKLWDFPEEAPINIEVMSKFSRHESILINDRFTIMLLTDFLNNIPKNLIIKNGGE